MGRRLRLCAACDRRQESAEFTTARSSCKSCQREQNNRYGETARGRARKLLAYARKRAKKKGLEFSISPGRISQAIARGVCETTGIPFVIRCGLGTSPWSPSIGRIDHGEGYTDSNIKVVCCALNMARSDWPDDDFKTLIAAVHRVLFP